MDFDILRSLSVKSESKIVFLVMDGLGGLPDPGTGKTELETAVTPNLDELASQGVCGLIDPVAPGITPGSGPGHLGLFGYDPLRFNLGRGVLEAAGVDFDLQENDVAARGNFATIDAEGRVTDRRAGRISTEKCAELCGLLDGFKAGGATVMVRPVREHRFLAVFRGRELSAEIDDTDPQQTGLAPRSAAAVAPQAEATARIVDAFQEHARKTLAGHHPANMALLRGFSKHPNLPGFGDIYKLAAAALAVYPMYRGLAKLAGMQALDAGDRIETQLENFRKNFGRFDFFFVHFKYTDSRGEDGDFQAKVKEIEKVDSMIPLIRNLAPDVLLVTGDHSTPAVLKSHSWHPVPVLLASRWCRPDQVRRFSETACIQGGLGRMPAVNLMPLAMANALKLKKYGA